MTLHAAIESVLLKFQRPMSTAEIAKELNKNKSYKKKDGSAINAFQIHGRTRKYPLLFSRSGSMVSLTGLPGKTSESTSKPTRKRKSTIVLAPDLQTLESSLMNQRQFKYAAEVDKLISYEPGIYCIRMKSVGVLPEPFQSILERRKHDIIYIGIASQSLNTRFLNQELRAVGHGTFFRSIGAVLGYKPIKGSLKKKSNKKNYTFSKTDKTEIIAWINSNLLVNWVEYTGDFDRIETALIEKHLPLLNIAKNRAALQELKELRAECVRIANL